MSNSQQGSDHSPSLGQHNIVWRSLISEPHTGVSVINRDGTIIYCNPQAAKIFLDAATDADDVIGRPLDSLFSAAFAEERMGLIRRVLDEDRPILFRGIWKGYQHVSWVYPADGVPVTDDDAADVPDELPPAEKVLVVTRRVAGDADAADLSDDGFEKLNAEVNDLGELDILSPRELVVIALLGGGLSLKETARLLHRSVRTIETQRDSIGQKLHLADRGELIKLVQRVGLTMDDTQRTNV